jgi:hypothetical protein
MSDILSTSTTHFGMTSSSPFPSLKGYTSKTIPYKSGPDGDILLDVVYPEETDGLPSTVLIHIHGGFLASTSNQ